MASGRCLEGERPVRYAVRKGEGIYDPEVLGRTVKKSRCSDEVSARTKTDTGRRDEYSKALERTLVKELGNITP